MIKFCYKNICVFRHYSIVLIMADMLFEKINYFVHIEMEAITDEEWRSFESLLLENIQENNPNIESVVDQIISTEENAFHFFSLLFKIITNSENKEGKQQAIIYVIFLISKSWERFSDEMKKEIREIVIALYSTIDEDMVYIYSQLVISIIKTDGRQNIEPFIQNVAMDDKGFHFHLYLVFAQLQLSHFGTLESYYHNILGMLLQGIQHPDPKTKIITIRILATLLDYFPDELANTDEHINYVIQTASNCEGWSPVDFMNLWKSIQALCFCSASDVEFITKLHDPIMKCCNMTNIPADYKLYPIRCLWHCADEYDRPVVRNIIKLTTQVAVEYVEQSSDLPFEFLFIFADGCNFYEHSILYQFSKTIFVDLVASDSRAKQIVGLCIIKLFIKNIPHQVIQDIDYLTNTIINFLKSDDYLLLVLSLNLICSFESLFAWNLVNFENFLPLIIPVLIHPHPDVRFHAVRAAHKCLIVYDTPLHLSLKIFQLVSKVIKEEIQPFLMIVGLAIKRELMIEDEIAIHYANFTLAMMNTSDLEMVGGACYVSLCIMSVNEPAQSVLLPKTIEVIQNILQVSNLTERLFGVERLLDMIKIFPKIGSEILHQMENQILEILTLDDEQFPLVIQETVLKLSSIEASNLDSNHPFCGKLIELAQKWLSFDQPSFNGTAIKTLQKLTPILSYESGLNVVRIFYDVSKLGKSIEVVCKAIKAIRNTFKRSKGPIKEEIAKIGYDIGMLYISGEMAVLNGVPPLGIDLDFNLFLEMGKMGRTILEINTDLLRIFFPFSSSIIELNNNMNTEIVMLSWVSAIKFNRLTPEEIVQTKNFALSMFVEDIPFPLIFPETKLLSALFDAKLVEWETINSKLNILDIWLERCNESNHMIKKTIANVVLLIWKVALHFGSGHLHQLILKTLDQYPPDDVKITSDMTNLWIECYENDKEITIPTDLIIKGAKSNIKVLTMSKIGRKTRNISDQQISKLYEILDALRKKEPKVQKIIEHYAHKYPSREQIFARFLQ